MESLGLRPFFCDDISDWDLLGFSPEACPIIWGGWGDHCGTIGCDWCEPHQCDLCAPGDRYPNPDLDLDPNDLREEFGSAIQGGLEVSIDAGRDEILEQSIPPHGDAGGRESESECKPATKGKGLTRPFVLEHEYGELDFCYQSRWEQGNILTQPGTNQEDGDLRTWHELDAGELWCLQPEGQEQRVNQYVTQAQVERQIQEDWDGSLSHGDINDADTGSLFSYKSASQAEEGEKVIGDEQQRQRQFDKEEGKTTKQGKAPLQPPLSSCSLCEEPDYEETLVGCDKCKAWFHISCVFLPEPPPEEEGWECPDCDPPEITQQDIKTREHVQESSNQRPKKAGISENRSSNRVGKKKDWTDYEKDSVTKLMKELIDEKTYHQTEEKWEVISERLSERYNLQRNRGSIKNKWGRELRARSGIDERKIEKPDKMTTSCESKEKRRAARKKRKNDEQTERHNDTSWLPGPSCRQAPMFSPSIMVADLPQSDKEMARKPRPSLTNQAPIHHSEIQELSMPVMTTGLASGPYNEETVRKQWPSLSDQASVSSLEVQEPSIQNQKRKRHSSNHDHHFDGHDRLLPDQDPSVRKRHRHA